MRTRRYAVFAAAALTATLLAACGDDDSDGGNDGDQSTETPASDGPGDMDDTSQGLATEQAEAALLTEAELPEGWTGQQQSDAGQNVPTGDGQIEPAECATLFESFDDSMAPGTEAQAAFSQGDLGPFLSHGVGAYDRAGADVVTEFRDTMDQCSSFSSSTQDGSEIQFEVQEGEPLELGDQSYTGRFVGSAEDETVELEFNMEVALIAQGSNLIMLSTMGLQETVADDEWQTIIDAAADKYTQEIAAL